MDGAALAVHDEEGAPERRRKRGHGLDDERAPVSRVDARVRQLEQPERLGADPHGHRERIEVVAEDVVESFLSARSTRSARVTRSTSDVHAHWSSCETLPAR